MNIMAQTKTRAALRCSFAIPFTGCKRWRKRSIKQNSIETLWHNGMRETKEKCWQQSDIYKCQIQYWTCTNFNYLHGMKTCSTCSGQPTDHLVQLALSRTDELDVRMKESNNKNTQPCQSTRHIYVDVSGDRPPFHQFTRTDTAVSVARKLLETSHSVPLTRQNVKFVFTYESVFVRWTANPHLYCIARLVQSSWNPSQQHNVHGHFSSLSV